MSPETPACSTPATSPASPSRSPRVEKKSTPKDKASKKKLSRQEASERDRKMAAGSGEGALRDLSHPSLGDHLKNHNTVTFKLVRTGEIYLFVESISVA